jgi:arylformamidase
MRASPHFRHSDGRLSEGYVRIYDVSHLLRPGLAVWPGDTGYSRRQEGRLADGDPSDVSSLLMSLHAGTHVDAPGHCLAGAATIEQVDLSWFVGPASLVTVPEVRAVDVVHLEDALCRRPERLLVHCNRAGELDRFEEEYTYFTLAAAEAVAAAGVRILGTDGPSVDAFEAVGLPVHRRLGERGVVILENLRLQDVPDGEYELAALPLKIKGGDASPVRAILLEGMQ